MGERRFFRCHAFGLISVQVCQANRARPLGARIVSAHVVAGASAVRPFECRECAQAGAVDDETEPTLMTAEAAYGGPISRNPAGRGLLEGHPNATRAAYEDVTVTGALPPDSPLAAIPDDPAESRRLRQRDRWRTRQTDLEDAAMSAPDLGVGAEEEEAPKSEQTGADGEHSPPLHEMERAESPSPHSGEGFGEGSPRRRPWGSLEAEVLEALRAGPAGPKHIAQQVGSAKKTAHWVLSRLERKGKVRRLFRGVYALPDGEPSADRAVLSLLRDLAAGRIGLPAAERRAERILRRLGKHPPPQPPARDWPLQDMERLTRNLAGRNDSKEAS